MMTTAIRTRLHSCSRMKPLRLCCAASACAFCICLATAPCLAESFSAVDEQPQQIDANTWRFAVQVGVRPLGTLEFVGSQYDFASPTQGIEVAYGFRRRGVDFSDSRTFYAISPTLFDQLDGFIDGWDLSDLRDGIFSGVVSATAPLTAVHFVIEADRLVPVHHAP
jgi:hypothetical protein